jgi:hypothetical protein
MGEFILLHAVAQIETRLGQILHNSKALVEWPRKQEKENCVFLLLHMSPCSTPVPE